MLTPAGFPLDEEDEVVLEDTAEPSEAGLKSLEDKIYRMEAQIGSIQNNLETIIPIIRGLSGARARISPHSITNLRAENRLLHNVR